jgi:hypothetical protein
VSGDAIAERYGRTPSARRRAVTIAAAAGAAAIVVVVAWVAWAGLFSPAASLETRDVGYSANDDGTVAIRFEVSTEPGTTVSCALQVLNQKYAIVGWKIVDLPASDERTRVFEDDLRVTEPAYSGLIYRCWLT